MGGNYIGGNVVCLPGRLQKASRMAGMARSWKCASAAQVRAGAEVAEAVRFELTDGCPSTVFKFDSPELCAALSSLPYRRKLAEKVVGVGKGWPTDWLDERPKQHEWDLCLVLMGKHVDALPFFAKCGIAWLLGELQRRGFKVSFQAV